MKGYEKQVKEALIAFGWRYLCPGKGSHEKWCDAAGKRTVTVPNGCKSRHTANGVLKQAGIKQKI